MLIAIIAMLIGLALLIFSADGFIDHAVTLANKYHMPKMLIGALIIGVGTSMPEIVVSSLSALAGSPGLALGNAFGSNIVNITLVLGVTALIAPIAIQKQVLKTDFSWLIVATIVAVGLMLDGNISRIDAIILLVLLIANICVQIIHAKRHAQATKTAILASTEAAHELAADELPAPDDVNTAKSVILLLVALFVLVSSSRLIVWGAVELATLLGLSDLIIGLTIVAIGTSLPELVSSVIAARRGEFEMALGNVLGSNLFNTLGVVGVAALIMPMSVDSEILNRDTLVMCAITALLFVLCAIAIKRDGQLGRLVGVLLISCFVAYSAWLIVSVLPI